MNLEDNYHFNAALKRFEPYERYCFYCKNKESNGQESTYFQNLFLEKKRLNLLVYRSVKYSTFSIGIPRCSACKEIHDGINMKSGIIGTSIGVLVFCVAKLKFEMHTILCIIIAFGALAIVSKLLKTELIRNHGIDSADKGAKNDPMVQQFLDDGWTTRKPSA
jgi:hypothetical protein